MNIAQLRGNQLTGGCYKVIDPIMEINKTVFINQRSQGL